MSVSLDVRNLFVLFGVAGREQMAVQSGRIFIFEDATINDMLRRLPGYRIGLIDLSFTVNSGECLAVLGVSGSGKSSLLRTIAGLQPTIRGTILVNGADVSSQPPERRGVVYLHQEPVLFPHLSVLENVAFPMTVRGVDNETAMHRAIEWLQRLQVAGVMGFLPESLSGGQRHRVALARALCADPAVLLLDEPLASLDPAVRRDVREALQEARAASGAAMVLVTHDLDDALAVATHIASIEQFGRLSTPALSADILEQPPSLETARVLGVYAEIDGEVSASPSGNLFRWIGGSLPAPQMAIGRAVACVRSHEVQLHRGNTLDLPSLTVTSLREGARDAVVTVQHALGEEASLRIASGTAVGVSETVQVTLRHARIFPSQPS
jgi:putative spermidine/putrescine transport system ATP-binding protein